MKNKYCAGQRLLAVLLCLDVLSSCQPRTDILPDASAQARLVNPLNYVPGEVLVRFKSEVSSNNAAKLLSDLNLVSSERILTSTMMKGGDQSGVLLVSTSDDVQETINELTSHPEIEFAEPNYIYKSIATSTDTYFTSGSLWGMCGSSTRPANQFGCGAASAWTANRLGSPNVVVGIIDEGVMVGHNDLINNIWVNPNEKINGRDDDGNGYVDDMNGWDFANNNSTVYDGIADDHGTHLAGTIGAMGANSRGVAGVCWNVKMISLKFMTNTGGTTANAIKAIDYLTDLKNRHRLNIVASNNSWSGGGYSLSLQQAIERANAAGILFIAGAGNGGSDQVGDNNDAVATYPASYPNANIIAVAAITAAGSRASFSNFGAKSVDIGAPGAGIWSTVPGSGNTSSYASYNGTSMATPHVTGAVALYKSLYPAATATQIRSAILSKAAPTPALAGRCVTGGRLNVASF